MIGRNLFFNSRGMRQHTQQRDDQGMVLFASSPTAMLLGQLSLGCHQVGRLLYPMLAFYLKSLGSSLIYSYPIIFLCVHLLEEPDLLVCRQWLIIERYISSTSWFLESSATLAILWPS